MPDINLNLGAQLYTIRDYMTNAADYEKALCRLSEIGYKYAQVSCIGSDITPKIIKKVSKNTGINIILTHWHTDKLLNNTDELIEEHKVFDCKAIGIGGCPYGNSRDAYLRFCEDYAAAFEKIKKAGMVFLFHNHRYEFEKFDEKYGIDIILENTDPDAVKLTFDTYWAVTAGIDPARFILDRPGRIFCTHLKDMKVVNNEVVMTEMLTGNINFDAVMEASLKTGVKWHFVEQDRVYMDSIESLKISHDNLKARYDMN